MGGRRRQRTSVLRVVHSWFLMSVCVFFIYYVHSVSSSSSLMHCHYNISTWKARDPQISRHWTKTLQIPVSLMMERWNKNVKRLLTAGGDGSSPSGSSDPFCLYVCLFRKHKITSSMIAKLDRERDIWEVKEKLKYIRENHSTIRLFTAKLYWRLTNVC